MSVKDTVYLVKEYTNLCNDPFAGKLLGSFGMAFSIALFAFSCTTYKISNKNSIKEREGKII